MWCMVLLFCSVQLHPWEQEHSLGLVDRILAFHLGFWVANLCTKKIANANTRGKPI